MAAFHRHPVSRAVLLTLLSVLAAPVSAQDDSGTFDCHITLGESKYDLTGLKSEFLLERTNSLPPATIEDKLTFNLCAPLSRNDDMPSDEQVRPHCLHWRGLLGL